MTSTPGLRHSLSDLKAMAEKHVSDEVTRVFALASIPGRGEVVGVAILEAYLLHVRNVHDFLTMPRRPKFPLDVVGADYFDRPWRGSCLERPRSTRSIGGWPI